MGPLAHQILGRLGLPVADDRDVWNFRGYDPWCANRDRRVGILDLAVADLLDRSPR